MIHRFIDKLGRAMEKSALDGGFFRTMSMVAFIIGLCLVILTVWFLVLALLSRVHFMLVVLYVGASLAQLCYCTFKGYWPED